MRGKSGPRGHVDARTTLTARKLRASCDSCASSKVKCDKEQPACRRCPSGGIKCVYGVSRKHGKQPRRRRSNATDRRTPTQSLASPPVQEATPSGAMHFQPELNMGFDDLPHDMGISGDMSTVHCAEQDLYGLHTDEFPILDDQWSSLVDLIPFFPNSSQSNCG